MSAVTKAFVLLVALSTVVHAIHWDFRPPIDKYVPANRAFSHKPWFFAFFTCHGIAKFTVPHDMDWAAAMARIDAYIISRKPPAATSDNGKVDCKKEGTHIAFYSSAYSAILVLNYRREDKRVRITVDPLARAQKSSQYRESFQNYDEWFDLGLETEKITENGIYNPKEVRFSEFKSKITFYFRNAVFILSIEGSTFTLKEKRAPTKEEINQISPYDPLKIGAALDSNTNGLYPELRKNKENGTTYFWVSLHYKHHMSNLYEPSSFYFVRQLTAVESDTAVLLANGADYLVDSDEPCPLEALRNLAYYKVVCSGIIRISLKGVVDIDAKIQQQVDLVKSVPCFKKNTDESVRYQASLAPISAKKLAVALPAENDKRLWFAVITMEKDGLYRFADQWFFEVEDKSPPFYTHYLGKGTDSFQLCFEKSCYSPNGKLGKDRPTKDMDRRNDMDTSFYSNDPHDENLHVISIVPVHLNDGTVIKKANSRIYLVSKPSVKYQLMCQVRNTGVSADDVGLADDATNFISEETLASLLYVDKGVAGGYVEPDIPKRAKFVENGQGTYSATVMSLISCLLLAFCS